MSVNAVQYSHQVETSRAFSNGGDQLGKSDFLKLLIAQMRYQNPMEPIKDTEYIAQLAQFNSLEQMQNLNAAFSTLLYWSQITQASSLIGKKVEAIDSDTGSLISGTVDEVRLGGGEPTLVAGEDEISLSEIRRIF